MEYIADLHIHSRYSIATSREGDLIHFARSALLKGIQVIGTGDYTHPRWVQDLQDFLVPDGKGLFFLHQDLEEEVVRDLPKRFAQKPIPVRFLLSTEISNVYKKDGKTRKSHNLVLFPDLQSVSALTEKLSKIGNVTYDGRPMLGMDAKDLLDTALSVSGECMFIPAHIWTPWFSVLGSKSGFDSIEECFEDLTGQITAVETGLSSDPPMNWMLSSLDRFSLISNSDAHSPVNLGREATVFSGEISYAGIKNALEGKESENYKGTLEFFPEEGKYHHDGHRACGVNLDPGEASKKNDLCPECGKPLTIGVLHRVLELADRAPGEKPPGAKPFENLIPLRQIIKQCLGYGDKSKKNIELTDRLIAEAGPEFELLRHADLSLIERHSNPVISEAVKRIRSGRVDWIPGYDGEFGRFRIFSDKEKQAFLGQKMLFPMNRPRKPAVPGERKKIPRTKKIKPSPDENSAEPDPDQKKIFQFTNKPLMVIAGPGTGKTWSLVEKVRSLEALGIRNICALTFTNRAAGEICSRLHRDSPWIGTIHSVALQLLESVYADKYSLISPQEAAFLLREFFGVKDSMCFQRNLSFRKGTMRSFLEGETGQAGDFINYMKVHDLIDLDDVILKAYELLSNNAEVRKYFKSCVQYVLVDEFQDVNLSQYYLIREMSHILDGRIMVIGDPWQAIYGFRGSEKGIFDRFQEDHQNLSVCSLKRNYRSAKKIVILSNRLAKDPDRIRAQRPENGYAEYSKLSSGMAEGIYIARIIAEKIGGIDMISSQKGGFEKDPWSFSDFAVLVRTERQMSVIETCLMREGLPYRMRGARSFLEANECRSFISLVRILKDPDNRLAWRIFLLSESLGLTRKEGKSVLSRAGTAKWGSRTILSLLDDLPGAERFRPLKDWLSRTGFLYKDLPTLIEHVFGTHEKGPVHDLAGLTLSCPHGDVFLNSVLLNRDMEREVIRTRSEGVSLLTIHASKGLEFPVVFCPGLEEGFLPLKQDEVEEEKRLFYVAITRARDEIYLSSVRKRNIFGKSVEREESGFLKTLKPLLKKIRPIRRKKEKNGQLELFS